MNRKCTLMDRAVCTRYKPLKKKHPISAASSKTYSQHQLTIKTVYNHYN